MPARDRPRVLHLSPTWFGEISVIGGGERFPLELARAMRDRVPTRLVAFGGPPTTADAAGFPIEVARTWRHLRSRPYDAIGPGFIPALLWADVVHCHQARTGLTALATLLARPLGKRVFVTDHGGGGVGWLRRARLGRWVHAHLAQSRFVVDTLPYLGRRTAIVHGGVDPQVFAPAAAKARGEVVFVGRLLPHKGIEHAIRALPDDAHLAVYGRPADLDYAAFLRREAEGRAVTFHENAGDRELVQALSRACVAVMPSVFEDFRGRHQQHPELLGLAALEAMACGTAVVVSQAGGLPEVVDPSYVAVVPPGDSAALRAALLPFTSDPDHAAACGARARERALRDFTWSAVADRCLAAYGYGPVPSPGRRGLG
ncbi:MAG: glycosyltransferase family 4 protein [Chloroflexi bacterium]|nr:glycosyltransferase family 4 protein [Chloroflexota bacterium]